MPNVTRASCLICGSRQLQPLLTLSEEGVPHGAARHNFTYAYHVIVICGACRHGQLESYSHDCYSQYADEDWDMYWWYAINPDAAQRLRDLLVDCPANLNVDCNCALHRSLRESSDRLWGGVKHAVDSTEKVKFAWLRLEEQPDRVTVEVDQQRGLAQAV